MMFIILEDTDTIVNDELNSPAKEKSNAEKKHDSPFTKGKDPLSDEDKEDDQQEIESEPLGKETVITEIV